MNDVNLQELVKGSSSSKTLLLEGQIQQLNIAQQDYISHLAVINEYLNLEDIKSFLAHCGFKPTNDEIQNLIEHGIRKNLLEPNTINGKPVPFFKIKDRVQQHIWNELKEEDKIRRHTYAEKFYEQIFVSAIKTIYKNDESIIGKLENQEEKTTLIIRPGGFIDLGAHYPQLPGFHDWSISRSYYWQDHLFYLRRFEDAADITNSICFALARRNRKKIAKALLIRNMAVTKGIHKTAAMVNYGTLLREDQEHKRALKIYKRVLLQLFWQKATYQIAGIFSEISNIHRDIGYPFRALIYQHLSRFIRSRSRDLKGKAICNNQLSIVYRNLGFRRLALRISKEAESYWRLSNDVVNLAKTLTTQGNIYYHLGKLEEALECFDESEEINLRIENYGELASSLSGKAKINIKMQNLEEAKKYLEESISFRERFSDKRVGIEFFYMGYLYEAQGNSALALGWYKKALPIFHKYQPTFVSNCQNKINGINNRRSK